ncbi:MAG: alpha/beta hydrolase fold domain-containing protein, partial [Halioglobus sp.]|nr:alpha/beta hydrolase fold domain-containing protein [Halioglobus sp.]
ADLAGLPPMYLQVGEYDTVRNGNLLLARNAEAAGVALRVEHWPGMVQGWHGLANAGVPEATAAWQAIGNYVAGVLAPR